MVDLHDVGAGVEEGVAYADVDLESMLGAARGGMYHLRDRRPEAYLTPQAV